RKGEEKMTFASKKEADAYDKMLDMAEAFTDWLLQSELPLDEAQFENLGLFLAEQKDAVQHILRTSKLPEAQSDNAVPKAADAESSKKMRAVKAA
ncbi:YebG family protein, partial [Mixta calida]